MTTNARMLLWFEFLMNFVSYSRYASSHDVDQKHGQRVLWFWSQAGGPMETALSLFPFKPRYSRSFSPIVIFRLRASVSSDSDVPRDSVLSFWAYDREVVL